MPAPITPPTTNADRRPEPERPFLDCVHPRSPLPRHGITARSAVARQRGALHGFAWPSFPPTRARQLARFTLIALLAALGLWIVFNFLPALIWAVVIAVAIDPLVNRAEARFPKTSRQRDRAWSSRSPSRCSSSPRSRSASRRARARRTTSLGWIAAARGHGVPPPAWLARIAVRVAANSTGWWNANLADPVAADHLFAAA